MHTSANLFLLIMLWVKFSFLCPFYMLENKGLEYISNLLKTTYLVRSKTGT